MMISRSVRFIILFKDSSPRKYLSISLCTLQYKGVTSCFFGKMLGDLYNKLKQVLGRSEWECWAPRGADCL